MRYRRLSLTARLSLITALLVFSLSATVGVALRVLARVETTAAELAVLREAQRRSQHADMDHDALRNSVLRILVGTQDGSEVNALLEEAQSEGAALTNELAYMAGMQLPPELHATITETQKIVNEYIRDASRIATISTLSRDRALSQMRQFDGSFEAAKLALAHQTEELSKASEAAAATSARAGAFAKRCLLLTGILGSLLGAALVVLIARSIRSSLERVRDVARAVATGDIDKRTEVTGDDEIGVLGESVNRMADHLQVTIDRMKAEAERSAFGSRLADAFEMADTEPDAHTVVARAMAAVSSEHPMELLIADSSKAHLEIAVEHPRAGAPGCTVRSPFGCVAVRRGNLVSFEDSDAIDACPHLRGRPCGPVSAVCVPIAFMGHSLGVLHVAGPVGQPPSEPQTARLRTIAMQAGSRIGTVRAFQRTQLQASTDALTGLPNRRALEEAMRRVLVEPEPFAFLLCDLDHFKRLNDEHGHPAGDSALRLFSEVLRAMLRPGDLAARWGGEEFCVMLAGATAAGAVGWADRVRDKLAESVLKSCSPTFTASFGVADSTMSRRLDELIQLADDALYRAKGAGRDRASVADAARISGEHVRQGSEQRAAIDMRMVSDGG